MDQNSNLQPAITRPANSEKFSDVQTKNKIHKHITDINDTISDQDIKNVITDISIIQSAVNSENSDMYNEGDAEEVKNSVSAVKEDIKEAKKAVEKDKDELYGTEEKQVNSPWDVLGA